MAKEGYYTIRLGDDEQTIRSLCEHINVDPDARGAYAKAIRFALRYTVAHVEAERPKEEAMQGINVEATYDVGQKIEALNPRTGEREAGTVTGYAFDGEHVTGLMVRFDGEQRAVEISAAFLAERPREGPITIYIAKDADYWGAEPTDAEIAALVEHTEQVAKEWTSRPVDVKVVDGSEAFTKSARNDPLAEEIAGAAWNRMFE
jgi:hypothetical protein